MSFFYDLWNVLEPFLFGVGLMGSLQDCVNYKGKVKSAWFWVVLFIVVEIDWVIVHWGIS